MGIMGIMKGSCASMRRSSLSGHYTAHSLRDGHRTLAPNLSLDRAPDLITRLRQRRALLVGELELA